METNTFPSWLLGFVDDAALFPPSATPLDRAVAEHRQHRASDFGALLGGFAISDLKVPDLIDVLDGYDEDAPLDINLVVTGGAGAIAPAVRWAVRAPHLRLHAIELALRDEDDLAYNAQRVLTALDAVEEDLAEVPVFVELPRWQHQPTHGWLSALDELAVGDLRAKLRTGGATADDVPSAADLAVCIEAALDRELAFRCTGGLTSAVRPGDGTGHGFLNVLLATRASLDGEDVVAALTAESAQDLLGKTDPDALARTRTWFTGFGAADVLEVHHDLVELGLLGPA